MSTDPSARCARPGAGETTVLFDSLAALTHEASEGSDDLVPAPISQMAGTDPTDTDRAAIWDVVTLRGGMS